MNSKYTIKLPNQGPIIPRRIHLHPFHPTSFPGSVLAYLGIPFCQPPLGSLRWKPPQGPLPHWTSPRPSLWRSDPHQDPAAMEGMYLPRRNARNSIPRSEDCLYLNIWLPETPLPSGERKRPVLVWVYGGAFVVGNCSRPIHDGARLANESGCIVVSLSYRVGPMGFLGSKALAENAAGEWPLISLEALKSKPEGGKVEVGAGNWGLWDLIAGLLWVQHSISAFGGDTDNVTFFGESAGSISIHYLLLSPLTPAGLFHKAILQSGVVATLLPRTTRAAQAAYDLLVHTLCPPHLQGDEASQLEWIRTKVSADEISAVFPPLIGKRPRSEYTPTVQDCERLPAAREDLKGEKFAVTDQWGPVWDGLLVDPNLITRALAPLPPKSQLKNGRAGVVVGMCADEGTMFNFLITTTSALAEHQKWFHPALSSDLGSLYSFNSAELATVKLGGKEKAKRDRQAFYTCATYTGDSQFTAPILDYMSVHNNAGGKREGERVGVYGYLLAYRPSLGMLEGLTVVPEMSEEWGAFHTLDIPFVFGATGDGDQHIFTGKSEEYGVDPTQDDADGGKSKAREAGGKGKGMTKEERELSLFMMQTWAAIAKLPNDEPENDLVLPDGVSWKTLGSGSSAMTGDSVREINLIAIGNVPQMHIPSITNAGERIAVRQMRLAEHPFAQKKPIGDATLEDRIRFWLHESISGTSNSDREGSVPLSRATQNYYGFIATAPRFIPWL